MKRVFRMKGNGKAKAVAPSALATLPAEDLDGRVELIPAVITLGLAAVAEALKQEVLTLAEERYRRTGGLQPFSFCMAVLAPSFSCLDA